MCGIAGIFEYKQEHAVNIDELTRISNHMRSRGPDGEGLWINQHKTVGFAHRRLSIIDLSDQASQPMHDLASQLSIVFNGEIYNYKKLRDELIAQGFIFKTHSDTEVLLKLYEKYRTEMLSKLRGMFAFAIWDEKNQTLFCARDPFGIKPFYFSDNGKTVRFASQVKALLASQSIDATLNPAGLVGFFLLGSVPEPHTLYQNIQSLDAGSYLLIHHNKIIQKKYYSIKDAFIRAENSCAKISLTENLYDTVQHHLIADVQVSVFLSAGIDSATIANIVSEIAPSPTTITLGFSEYQNTEKNEVPFAETIAKHFHTHQKTVWISKDDAMHEREKIFHHMDQPSIDGINTYFVSLAAAQQGLKVALSGLGADELFAGYLHFSRISTLLKYAKPFSPIGKLFRAVSQKILTAKKASLLEYANNVPSLYFLTRAILMPWELENFLDKDLIQIGLEKLNLLSRLQEDIAGIQSIRFQISALEIQWYMRNQLLRDSDWAGMAHSLEIRVPFVDVSFFEAVIAAQTLTKKDLAMAAKRPLPPSVLHRKKTGFNIPVSTWYAGADRTQWIKTVYEYSRNFGVLSR